MAFCPKCKAEYRPEFNKCADCDTWLVSVLLEEPEPIYATFDRKTLHRITKPLTNAGLKFVASQVQEKKGWAADKLPSYFVSVSRKDSQRAKLIIKEQLKKPNEMLRSETTEEFFTCSECGAEVGKNTRVCPSCGEAFED